MTTTNAAPAPGHRRREQRYQQLRTHLTTLKLLKRPRPCWPSSTGPHREELSPTAALERLLRIEAPARSSSSDPNSVRSENAAPVFFVAVRPLVNHPGRFGGAGRWWSR